MPFPFTADDLARLKQWDTPTICNGLELIVPERRAIGFTVHSMHAADRKLPPIVGLARVGTIRAKEPPRGKTADRLADTAAMLQRAAALSARVERDDSGAWRIQRAQP